MRALKRSLFARALPVTVSEPILLPRFFTVNRTFAGDESRKRTIVRFANVRGLRLSLESTTGFAATGGATGGSTGAVAGGSDAGGSDAGASATGGSVAGGGGGGGGGGVGGGGSMAWLE